MGYFLFFTFSTRVRTAPDGEPTQVSNLSALPELSLPDCESRLLRQAEMTRAAGGKHVFVYRNVVKALPWFASVREKLVVT